MTAKHGDVTIVTKRVFARITLGRHGAKCWQINVLFYWGNFLYNLLRGSLVLIGQNAGKTAHSCLALRKGRVCWLRGMLVKKYGFGIVYKDYV